MRKIVQDDYTATPGQKYPLHLPQSQGDIRDLKNHSKKQSKLLITIEMLEAQHEINVQSSTWYKKSV